MNVLHRPQAGIDIDMKKKLGFKTCRNNAVRQSLQAEPVVGNKHSQESGVGTGPVNLVSTYLGSAISEVCLAFLEVLAKTPALKKISDPVNHAWNKYFA